MANAGAMRFIICTSQGLSTCPRLMNCGRVALKGQALETVREGHRAVKGVLERTDPRLIVVVGPCSIHNPDEAMQYARLLKPLADELSDELLILMRVYFEKPRTSVGWEGLIMIRFSMAVTELIRDCVSVENSCWRSLSWACRSRLKRSI